MTKAFTKATGIPVSLDDDSTGPLLAKVAAERNNPQWGLLWVDGEYKGKVGMNDPSQSGPTFPLIAGLMNELGGQSNGVSAGEQFLTKLKANGLMVHPTNGDTLHALETGQIDYGLIQSSAAMGEVATAKTSANFQPKVVYLGTTTLLPGVIGIDKGASAQEQKEAEQFVQYVLSAAGQQVMQTGDPTGDSLYWPIVPGVNPVSAAGTMPAAYQRIDPGFWGPLESQVNTFFDNTVK